MVAIERAPLVGLQGRPVVVDVPFAALFYYYEVLSVFVAPHPQLRVKLLERGTAKALMQLKRGT